MINLIFILFVIGALFFITNNTDVTKLILTINLSISFTLKMLIKLRNCGAFYLHKTPLSVSVINKNTFVLSLFR